MEVLNVEQSREFDRDNLLLECLNTNKSVYDKYLPFKMEALLFMDNFSIFKSYIPVKEKKGKGVITDKNKLKQTIAEEANTICTAVTAYAASISDADLAYAVRYRTNTIKRLKNSEVEAIITAILDSVTPLMEVPGFEIYNITTAMLDSLREKAGSYDSLVAKAGTADKKSSIANAGINQSIIAIRANIRRLSLLIVNIKYKEPAFYQDYLKAIAVNNSNIHHSGITGIIKDANGLPIYNAVITCLPYEDTTTGGDKSKIAKADKLGAYELAKVRPGLRTFTFTAPGYEEQTVMLHILRGKILDCNIALIAKVITMSATA